MSNFVHGGQVQANGIRQHYLRYGGDSGERTKRPSIVLIPGITSPAITWDFVGERFGRSFDTYILDVRGRGLSEASEFLDYSLDAQAADLTGFTRAMGLSTFAFVGHSMGARIAARSAAQQPFGLERVVLIDPPISGPGRRAYPAKIEWYLESIALAKAGCDAEAMRPFLPTWSDEQLQLRAEWLHTCDPRAVIESFNGFHTDEFHPDLALVNVPALLMTASRSEVIRPDDAKELLAIKPSMIHRNVPDAGHMIPWDNETGFYAAFEEFLGCPL